MLDANGSLIYLDLDSTRAAMEAALKAASDADDKEIALLEQHMSVMPKRCPERLRAERTIASIRAGKRSYNTGRK